MFSKYTFFTFLVGAAAIGSLKEVVKVCFSESVLEGWMLIFPILATSGYLILYFTGAIFGYEIKFPLVVSSSKFLFITTFSSIFAFTFYGVFLSSGIQIAFLESILYGLLFAIVSVIIMKCFYRSNVKKLLNR